MSTRCRLGERPFAGFSSLSAADQLGECILRVEVTREGALPSMGLRGVVGGKLDTLGDGGRPPLDLAETEGTEVLDPA